MRNPVFVQASVIDGHTDISLDHRPRLVATGERTAPRARTRHDSRDNDTVPDPSGTGALARGSVSWAGGERGRNADRAAEAQGCLGCGARVARATLHDCGV